MGEKKSSDTEIKYPEEIKKKSEPDWLMLKVNSSLISGSKGEKTTLERKLRKKRKARKKNPAGSPAETIPRRA